MGIKFYKTLPIYITSKALTKNISGLERTAMKEKI